jgi:hypothetical protein
VGGGDFVCASRDDSSLWRAVGTVAARLDFVLTVVVVVVVLTVVVVVGAETAGVTGIVVVEVELVGEGMTTPDGGSDTTPIEEVRVGPLGWLWGTNTMPKTPITTNARETAHHTICGGRFSFRDFTSPNLVWLS